MSTNNLLPSTSAGGFSTVGNIAGNVFIGNGSQLTGVVVSAGNSIVNGTSSVTIPTANANVEINVGEAAYTFDDTGNLQLVNGFVIGASGGDADITTNNSLNIYAQNGIELFTTGGDYAWNFDANGNLSFPGGANISSGNLNGGVASASVALNAFAPDGNTVTIQAQGNSSLAVIKAYDAANTVTREWSFDNAGNLHVPQGGYIGPAGVKGDGTMLTGGPGNITSLTSYYADNVGMYSSCVTLNADGTLNLTTYGNGTGQLGQWNFANTTLNVPGNGSITTTVAVSGGSGNSISIVAGSADQNNLNSLAGGNLNLTGGLGGFADDGIGGAGGDVNITAGAPGEAGGVAGNINITSSGNTWTFDNTGNLTVPNSILNTTISSPAPAISGFTFIGELHGNVSAGGVVVSPKFSSVGNIAISTGNVANATSTIDFNVSGSTFGSLGVGVALGYGAGNGLGNIANAIQTSGIAIGTTAGQNKQGTHGIAVGWNTASITQGNSAVAIGENAAWVTQGDFAVALGAVAGRESQSANAVAIGTRAGLSSQGGRSVAIGTDAGNTSQGADSVAIGTTAGLDTQGTNSVAIGKYAGNANQGSSSVAVGASAGQSVQGVNSVAVGVAAAERGQGNAATALGWNAGQINQGNLAIAVGSGAAYNGQGNAAIAIGADTSPINQGAYSIAIGAGASTGNIQANNSIIIDATGTGTTPAAAAGLYITPVRNDAANVGNVVTYNTATKELTYTNTISVAGNVYGTNVTTKATGSWTLDPGSNTVSITVPVNGTYSMWVNGNIPNGIVVWNATVTVTNNNVPVVGSQYGWYYTGGGDALVLTSIPAQIVGTAGAISNATVGGSTNNVFSFGITNNSGSAQVVNWGYITL